MSEVRKRSRKSKLEVRDDDCDYEVVNEENDETKPHLQITQKLVKFEPITRNDHDYCKPGYQGFAYSNLHIFDASNISLRGSTVIAVQRTQSSSGSMDVAVKVEVGQFDNYGKEKSMFPEKRQYSMVRTMESLMCQKRTNRKEKGAIKMCKYDPELIFNVSNHIASKSNNLADRILDIEMRNLWGNVLCTSNEVSAHETKVQKALETWQAWYNGSRLVRDGPLFYQCHICNIAWWRLQPFREHIKTHDIESLKVTLEENIHECMLIASYIPVNKMKFIDIEDDCMRCGKDIEFHKKNSQVYMCQRCTRSQYTCSALREHESTCLYTNLANFNISKERQCTICKYFISSLNDVEKHMINSHSVRSDIPVPVTCKHCMTCNSKYFTYSTHNCSKSAKNSACDNCCRKFATKQLAFAHMCSKYNREIECKICSKPIKTRCQEMEHVYLEHPNNYQMAYKCTICTNPNQHLLFADELSIRMHRQQWHHKKSDRRRSYYEMMLLPKQCLQDADVEEAFQTGTEPSEPLSTRKDKNYDEQDFSIANSSNEPANQKILTADIDVTVDEVYIKREPVEYNENADIDYEDMLNNMFNQSDEKETLSKKGQKTSKDVVKMKPTVEFDWNVQVKSEPIDDIDIIDNPVEDVKIKMEPVDEPEEYLEYQNKSTEIHNQSNSKNYNQSENENHIESENKEHNQSEIQNQNEIETENIVIKNEIESDDEQNRGDISTEVIPFDQLITDLDMFKSGDMDWVSEEVLNPDEISFDLINPSGVYKKKRIYACHKCGYTAQHKQYRIHVTSKCSVSPGINVSHPCSMCGLTFVMFRNYVLHFDTHGYEVMSCPKCGMKFETLVKLLSHVQKHIKNNFVGIHVLDKGGKESTRTLKKVKCQECHEIVPQVDMFGHWEAHLTIKEKTAEKPKEETQIKEEPPELTVDCERVTINNKTLEPTALKAAIENLQSNNINERECVICYRAFARRYDVKRHVVEHLLMDAHMKKSKYRVFRCQICFQGFERPEKYKFHMRDHGSMPIFKCELCNKTFSDSSNFAKHKKTHNVRVLICDLCSKKFHSKSALEKHIADHTNLPKTKCAFCDKIFLTKQSYKKHKYQIHIKNKFKCVLCDLSFTSLQQKWDHNWEVHKERKQAADCPICLKSFRKFHDVRVHARAEHCAEVCVIKQARRRNVQFYKVKDLTQKNETLVVRE